MSSHAFLCLPDPVFSRSESPKDSLISISKEITVSPRDVLIIIDSLKRQIAADRCVFIKEKVEGNRKNLAGITHNICKLSSERKNSIIDDSDKSLVLLSKRQRDALNMQNKMGTGSAEKNVNCYEEDFHPPSAVLLGSSIAIKNAIRPLILAEVKRLPPYTTWIFLHRNQRMTEDQTVVGRRRIYYDQNGGEALICSDSEEDLVEEEEDNREFTESEDYIIRMTVEKVGDSDMTVDLLAQCLSRKPCEVKARCKAFTHGDTNVEDKPQDMDPFSEKDLDAALDSFDNLFCRRCLVFDCRLHGCSQDLVFPVERQHSWSIDEEITSCGPFCYKLTLKSQSLASMMPLIDNVVDKKMKFSTVEYASSNARLISKSSKLEVRHEVGSTPLLCKPSNSKSGSKNVGRKRKSKQFMGTVVTCSRKKQNKMATYSSNALIDGDAMTNNITVEAGSHKPSENVQPLPKRKRSPTSEMYGRQELMTEGGCETFQGQVLCKAKCTKFMAIGDEMLKEEEHVAENVCMQEESEAETLSWGAMEKSLFDKGLEIFGTSSCLIARNLLTGMKTCLEVFQYMNSYDNKREEAMDAANMLECHSNIDCSYTVGNELTRKSGFLRRRGKVRRLKYTWKSTGYHSTRKRISERKDQPCRQFNPCGCRSACGKLCSCLLNGTCCEKYCGCGKNCKNRFRGCHCAKSQCRSRQCPCFAAGRECDPDVCRNCWISCGDGSLGGPSQSGDNYECCNMKLLLKQQQRVLLGLSDVSGWGAFLKNSVGKHEYLGEYTGELISHREADKRGKIYDRENSSFLFNLNDQFVLDAFRKGDKLKFANHSPDPNCYAKVMMVAGDHRVGIFAKERINAGEELFYDYRYDADRAPAWARKPDVCGAKKEDSHVSAPLGRPKKLA